MCMFLHSYHSYSYHMPTKQRKNAAAGAKTEHKIEFKIKYPTYAKKMRVKRILV